MSEIPYYFDTPVPRYFREADWFKNPKTRLFVMWAFERCSTIEKSIQYDGQNITLKPYQFIFGRRVCAEELGLTENMVRNQVLIMENAGFLKNATNRITKRFTIYEWVLTSFLKSNHQVNNQLATKKQPSNHHNQKNREERSKEDHHPNPSSQKSASGDDAPLGLTDDLSLKKKKNEAKIEIVPQVFITKEQLEQCIAVKGSLESVKHAIGYIMGSPGRKQKIYDWPNTLAKWTIKDDIKPKLQEHEEMAKRFERDYGNYTSGWSCRVYHDRNKDQKGLLFSAESAFLEPYFIAFIDKDFKEKASKFLRDKKMQKARITKS